MNYLTPQRRIKLEKILKEGITGTPGPQGLIGPQGEQGPKGDTGERGIQGLKGDTGSQGIQGVAGYTPVKGIDYFDGAQGIQGIKGDTGQQGIQGVKGDKGDQGIQGIQGEQGLPGSDANVTNANVINAIGYTPVNPSTLKTVATTGSYNDLTSKPTIPTQMVLSGAVLPTPSSTYRGKIFTVLGGTDTADKHYICGKNADNTYSWKPITGFSW
jgi:hypothetical protein